MLNKIAISILIRLPPFTKKDLTATPLKHSLWVVERHPNR
jgi:hypothetical protein